MIVRNLPISQVEKAIKSEQHIVYKMQQQRNSIDYLKYQKYQLFLKKNFIRLSWLLAATQSLLLHSWQKCIYLRVFFVFVCFCFFSDVLFISISFLRKGSPVHFLQYTNTTLFIYYTVSLFFFLLLRQSHFPELFQLSDDIIRKNKSDFIFICFTLTFASY